MSKLRTLSLFSGIGGIELGLERTGGFETVAFCEWDKHCQAVLRKNWPDVQIFGDVNNLTKNDIQGQVDVITGGFPCTDVSFAGKQKGLFDENGNRTRSGLWKEYHRLIDELRPKYCVIENVEHLRKNGLGIVLHDLARIGYDVEWATLTANSVGYPHQRRRLFLISYPSSQRQHQCVKQDGHLQVNSEWETAQAYGEGQERESELIQVRPVLSRGTFDRIRSAYSDESAAITGLLRVTDGISSKSHEAARKQRIKQLGNAVVPRIAEIIGKAILEDIK